MTTTIAGRPERPHPIRPSLPRTPPKSPSAAGWQTLAGHRAAVVDFLRRRCRDEHQAEDLAHDTLLRAARHVTALARVERPRAWLVQIAANVQRDLIRKESRVQLRPPSDAAFLSVQGTEPIPGEDDPATCFAVDGSLFGREELLGEIDRAWEHLGPADRDVLAAYYREGGSTRSAAAAVKVNASLAKVRLFRARRRLEAELRRRVLSRSSANPSLADCRSRRDPRGSLERTPH